MAKHMVQPMCFFVFFWRLINSFVKMRQSLLFVNGVSSEKPFISVYAAVRSFKKEEFYEENWFIRKHYHRVSDRCCHRSCHEYPFPSVFPYFDEHLFTPLGKIFINLILMLVVPLVFFSIAVGTASIGNPKKLGRIGAKTMLYFLVSVVSALILGIGLTYLFKPGLRGEFDLTNVHLDFDSAVVQEQLSLMESLINIIPTNPIQAMGEGRYVANYRLFRF